MRLSSNVVHHASTGSEAESAESAPPSKAVGATGSIGSMSVPLTLHAVTVMSVRHAANGVPRIMGAARHRKAAASVMGPPHHAALRGFVAAVRRVQGVCT